MSGVFNVLGLVAGSIGLVPYLLNLFAPNTKDNTNVRVVLESSVDEAASMGGNTVGASL